MPATIQPRSCCVKSSISNTGLTLMNVRSLSFVDVRLWKPPLVINLDSLTILARSSRSPSTRSVQTLQSPHRMRLVSSERCLVRFNGPALKLPFNLVQKFLSSVVRSQLLQLKICVMRTKLWKKPKWTTMLDSNFVHWVRFQIWFWLQWAMPLGEFVGKATANAVTFLCLLQKKSWMVTPQITSFWIGEVFVFPVCPEVPWTLNLLESWISNMRSCNG